MKKHLLKSLIAISFTLPVFANQHAMQETPDPNPCSRWGTNCATNFYASIEALFLKPLFSSYAREQNVTDVVTSSSYRQYTPFANKFTPAVRAAIGCNTNWDCWDLNLIYTGLDYSYTNAFYAEKDPYPYSGITTQKFYYNQGDLDLGRYCKISRKLSLRPHFGVRGLWLVQKTKNFYESLGFSGFATDLSKADGRLIGAEAGLDSFWRLSSEFVVYANAGIATLVNSQKYSYSSEGDLSDSYDKTNNEVRIVNGYDFAIGVRWDKNIHNNDYHIAINFGYEHHSLINLNSNAARDFVNYRDFTMQGIALGLRFDF